jgi:hypothetical protein
MSGAIQLFPLYAFVAWTQTTLPFAVTIIYGLFNNAVSSRDCVASNAVVKTV